MEKSRNIYRRINKAIFNATAIGKLSADRRHFPQAFTHSGRSSGFSAFVHELLSRRRLTFVSSQKADFRVVAAISPELWRRSFLKLGKKEKKVNTLPMRMQRALGSRPYYSREVSTIKGDEKNWRIECTSLGFKYEYYLISLSRKLHTMNGWKPQMTWRSSTASLKDLIDRLW